VSNIDFTGMPVQKQPVTIIGLSWGTIVKVEISEIGNFGS